MRRWGHKTDVKLFRELIRLRRFKYALESEPISPDDIEVIVSHSKIAGGKVISGISSYYKLRNFTYRLEAGKPSVFIDFPDLCDRLKRMHVKGNMKVTIDIAYVEK